MPPRSKYYFPLESNPDVFTRLINNLGTKDLEFQDVYSLDEPDLLAMITRPVLALILVFPDTESIQNKYQEDEDANLPEYNGSGEDEDVIWFRQTIGNACGLYAILHALTNGRARKFIGANTPLDNFLKKAIPLAPAERAVALEEDVAIEQAHTQAAMQGDSAVPESADAHVDYHYICFAPSNKNNKLYELNGCRKGPINREVEINLKEDGDLLNEGGLEFVRNFLKRELSRGIENQNFSLMALVPA